MLVATAVATDQLHPGAAKREVEDTSVRRVHQIQAHDLSYSRLARELALAVYQHDVAEAAHGGEGRPRAPEGRHPPVLDEYVVQRDGQLSVDRRPVRRVGRLDDDGGVQAHLLGEVLADVRVVPVDSRVWEPQLVGELSSRRYRRLRLLGHTVVTVLQP